MTRQVGGAELTGSTVLILGGAGLVGEAVARAMLQYNPRRVVVAGLTQEEAEGSVAELRSEFAGSDSAIDPYWGNLFVPASMKDKPRSDIDARSACAASRRSSKPLGRPISPSLLLSRRLVWVWRQPC